MFALPSELCFGSFHWCVLLENPIWDVSAFLRLVLPRFFFVCTPSPFPAPVKCVSLNVLYYFSHNIHIVVLIFLPCTQNAKLSQSLKKKKKKGYSTGWKKYGTRPKLKEKKITIKLKGYVGLRM